MCAILSLSLCLIGCGRFHNALKGISFILPAPLVADEVAHAKIVERPVTVNEIKGLLDAAYE